MRFSCGDLRDHIVSSKIDHGPSVVRLKSDAAADEVRNIKVSRDIWTGSIFDFCNSICHKQTLSAHSVELRQTALV